MKMSDAHIRVVRRRVYDINCFSLIAAHEYCLLIESRWMDERSSSTLERILFPYKG